MKLIFYLAIVVGIIGALLVMLHPAQLQGADPSPLLMRQHVLTERPFHIVAEAPGRIWFTLPDANALGSLVVTDTAAISTTMFTTYPVPTAASQPYDLLFVDGVIWFTEHAGNKIGRFTPQSGTFEEFSIPTEDSGPTGLAVAPDGAIWFTERTGNKIGRFDPDTHQFTEYVYETPDAQFEDIVALDNNTVWATAPNLNKIVQLQRTGPIYSFFEQSTEPYMQPTGLVLASDQHLWVTARQPGMLLRYTPEEPAPWQPYALPTPDGGAAIVVFRDLGSVWEFWFTQHTSSKVGQLRIRPDGTLINMRERSLPEDAGQPWGVAIAADGNVWVAAGEGRQIIQWQPPYFELPQGPSEAFLPVIMSEKCVESKAPTLFGVQQYGATGKVNPYHKFLVESGAHWIRNEIYWAQVEPTNLEPEQFIWSSVDAVTGAAREDCFNLILTIYGNPTWAADYAGGSVNRVGLEEFVEFVTAVVERYDGDGQADAPGSPVVNFFEFYNEPDAGWFAFGHDAAAYAAMLAAVYPAVKEANPQAQVVFGGIAHDGFIEHGGSFVRSFLDSVLAAGGGAHFDYMNFHYYPAFAGNWTQGNGPGLLEKTLAIRSQLDAHGIEKPMLITETGWPNPDQTGSADANDTQSRYVVALHTQGLAAGVEMIVWWPLVDLDPFVWNLGLITSGQPPVKKPAFAVYQRMVAELSQVVYTPDLPQPETDHEDLEVHTFLDRANGQPLYVAWLNPLNSTGVADLRVPATRASVRDMYGNTRTVEDDDDEQSDGRVTVDVSAPVYIRVLE